MLHNEQYMLSQLPVHFGAVQYQTKRVLSLKLMFEPSNPSTLILKVLKNIFLVTANTRKMLTFGNKADVKCKKIVSYKSISLIFKLKSNFNLCHKPSKNEMQKFLGSKFFLGE